MIEHKRKHTKVHKCKICNEGFYTEERLDKHQTKETHSHACDHCERSYVNKQSLMRHKLSHSEKIHKCDQCSRAFKTQRDLRCHVEGMHPQSRDFVCDVCEKAFSRPEKLKRHLMIHAPDRPVYSCPFKNHVGCEKTFYRKDKLTRHLYSHSKVKPFKCDQCDKSFARTDNLREHIRSHTGDFYWSCALSYTNIAHRSSKLVWLDSCNASKEHWTEADLLSYHSNNRQLFVLFCVIGQNRLGIGTEIVNLNTLVYSKQQQHLLTVLFVYSYFFNLHFMIISLGYTLAEADLEVQQTTAQESKKVIIFS